MGYATNVPNPDEIHPTSFPVNVSPLAPCPTDPTPQDTGGFAGMRAGGASNAGYQNAEHGIASEFLGAQNMITAGRPAPQAGPPSELWDGSPGGHTMPPVVYRGN